MVQQLVIQNCVQVRLKWTNFGIVWMNSLFAQYTLAGPLNPTVAESIFAAIKASAAATTFLGLCHSQLIFTGVGVRDVRAPNNPELVSSGAAAAGTNGATSPMPAQVASVVTLQTPFAGRQFRGRVYLSGYVLGAGDSNGRIGAGTNTGAVGFVTAVQTALSAQSMTLAIGQRKLPPRTAHDGSELPERPANVVPVTRIVALNTRWDTQRRRLQ